MKPTTAPAWLGLKSRPPVCGRITVRRSEFRIKGKKKYHLQHHLREKGGAARTLRSDNRILLSGPLNVVKGHMKIIRKHSAELSLPGENLPWRLDGWQRPCLVTVNDGNKSATTEFAI